MSSLPCNVDQTATTNVAASGFGDVNVRAAIEALVAKARDASSVRYAKEGPVITTERNDGREVLAYVSDERRIANALTDITIYLRFDVANATPQSLNHLPCDAALHLLKQNQERGALILAADIFHFLDQVHINELLEWDIDDFLDFITAQIEGSGSSALLELISANA